MNGKVLILGAGVAGMSATLDLANAGCEVYLVEKEKEIGGKAHQYSCKGTEDCQRCSACLAFHFSNQIQHHPNVRLLPYSMITALSGKPGNFKASVRLLNETRLDLGAETTLEVQAILVATGFKFYHPLNKGEYGYGQYANVMIADELELFLLQLSGQKRQLPKHIALMQCFGSWSIGTGSERKYCSRVCCAYTARLAEKLHFLFPEASIQVFYQDRQYFGKTPRAFWGKLEAVKAIEYVHGLPAQVLGYPKGRVSARYADTFNGKIYEDEFDWLILVPGMLPPEDGLADIVGLQLERNAEGFYAERGIGVSQAGIFVAGACQGPKDIPQSIAHAKAAAGQILYYLQSLSS